MHSGTLLLALGTLLSLPLTAADFHGWKDAVVLDNGTVTAVIVPSLGRVMAFGFKGDVERPFWNNRTMDGKTVDAKSSEWLNFGGDKSWPETQSEWPKVIGRAWPPPSGFDQSPVVVRMHGKDVELLSPMDEHYGIRVRRMISLDPVKPEMTIKTTYEKLKGDPIKTGVWVITQLQSPTRATAATKAGVWKKQSKDEPFGLDVQPGSISVMRNPTKSTKLGTPGNILIWNGPNLKLEIERVGNEDGEFPDEGSHIEIYTNPDPLPYVELETMGPLRILKVGDSIDATNRYRLSR